ELQFHPYVRPLGFVDDIYGCIRDADICIVPVRRGVGMLTKVIDSMAVGTPVVMFDFASRGIPDLRDGIHAYVAATEEEFLRQVDRALSDPAATQAMSTRARGLVERNFDWDSHVAQLDAIVRGPSGSTGG
ncbi:MAG TPA: glycosyltransferase, partial [Thermoplasmata archaeon]|nr:glycosyltransferase [Thermoplasmata archaeon]